MAKAILSKTNKHVSVTLPDFKLYFISIVIKTAWYWHKDKHVVEWSRIESPEINPHICDQLIYNRGAKISGVRTVSPINGAEKTGEPHAKE